MLQAMQQPATSQPSPSLSSFAGLLATLASPAPQSDAPADALLWDSSNLDEDVATLSYERALRAHARYRPLDRDLDRDSDRVDAVRTPAGDRGSDARTDAPGEIDAAGAPVTVDGAPDWQTVAAPDRDLRSASVTIRLSRAECARLHQRAAEAGLTVSAYLRSCAVEAESLRVQVKQALAELKAGSKPPQQAQIACRGPRQGAREQGSTKPERRNFFGWIRWLARRGR